jgi:hypothetical protein
MLLNNLSLSRIRIAVTAICLALFVSLEYFPLLKSGILIVDDWGNIVRTLYCDSYWECYKSWFPLFSNRPLAPLPITSVTLLFAKNYSWYVLFNSLVYFLGVALVARILYKLLGLFSMYIFFGLCAIPTIAMPLIVSPINQLTATFSFLYWAISVWAIYKYAVNKSKWLLAISWL